MNRTKWFGWVMLGLLLAVGCSSNNVGVPAEREHPRETKTYDVEFQSIWDLLPEALQRAGLVYKSSDLHLKVVNGIAQESRVEKEEQIQVYVDKLGEERTRVEVVTRRTLKLNEKPRGWGTRVLNELDWLLIQTDQDDEDE